MADPCHFCHLARHTPPLSLVTTIELKSISTRPKHYLLEPDGPVHGHPLRTGLPPFLFSFLVGAICPPSFLTVHPSTDKLHILDPKGFNNMHLMHWVRPPLLVGKVEETELSQ